MSRIAVLGALLLLGCPDKKEPVPDSPQAPVLAPGAREATLKCVLEAPAGWTVSASPMPDHILELIANAPNLRGRMVLREANESTVALTIEQQKKRTQDSWGTQPDFTLLREDALGEGRVLAFQWRPRPSAPIERHLIAVLTIESKVVMALIDDDGSTPERNLLGAIGTLKCSPK